MSPYRAMSRLLSLAGPIVILVAAAEPASAGIIRPDSCLPQYKYTKLPPPLHYLTPGGPVFVDNVLHYGFTSCVNLVNNPALDEFGEEIIHNFGSIVTGTLVLPSLPPQPFQVNAPVSVRIRNIDINLLDNIHPFETEILQLDLVGLPIRETPGSVPGVSASMGQTTVTELGPGLFHIDSFFDVFTELVLPPLPPIPATDRVTGRPVPARVVLPEPGALALAGAGLLLLGMARARRSA